MAEKHIQEEEPLAERLTDEKMAKKLAKVLKEGGKRGVEIEGAADMGGLQFFCTSVELPEDDVDLLYESMRGMNAKCDPSEEERKGGSSKVGKMIFSFNEGAVAVVAYVPEHQQDKLTAGPWLKKVLEQVKDGLDIPLIKENKTFATAVIKADKEKDLFSIKIRDAALQNAINYLKPLGLFPDGDDESDDEMVFGDDDFPSM